MFFREELTVLREAVAVISSPYSKGGGRFHSLGDPSEAVLDRRLESTTAVEKLLQ
jgi:hypothetical protein